MSQVISSPPHEATVAEVCAAASEEVYVTPASYAQQRLWFLHQLEPDSAAYNIAGAVRMEGRLDADALARCFDELVRRHETLRTNFTVSDGEPMQVIAPARPFRLTRVDLRGDAAAEQEARRQIAESAARPFDPVRDELLRATLFALGEEEYLLLLVMDHIISDGWSLGVLVRELMALYEAFNAGRPSPLAELEIHYLDYAAWQREWLTGELLEGQLSYWRGQLGGTLPVVELPSSRRGAEQTARGASEPVVLSEQLVGALEELSRRRGATLYMTLLAAFQTLLQRYTGLEDVCVGTPVAGRARPETHDLIGFFVNTLVMRADLSGDPRFEELLERVRQTALDAHANQDVPFEMLVEQLRPERSLNHTPLFQVMFALQNAPLPEMQLPGLKVTRVEVESPSAKFDLTLTLEQTARGLTGALQYRADRFTPEWAERLVRHFERLLAAVAADPRARLSELPLMSDEERRRLLVEWNDTARAYPSDECLHQLFERQAAATPDRLALVFEDEQLTYRELNARANQLARHLRALGVGADSLVGVFVERSVEMVVALLGTLKAGAAYVALDPSYPSDRLAFMVEDSDAAVILTQRSLRDSLPEGSGLVVFVDDPTAFETFGDDDLATATTPDNLAYVIYTSGSTGRPKGVVVSHRAICNHTRWMQERFPLGETDRVLQKTPFSFDASVWEFYAPLVAGAQLVMARPGGHQDAAYLSAEIARRGVTVVQTVPTLLQMLLEEPSFESGRTLRRVFCGGEALSAELQERFFRRTGAELVNLYGPTEATIDATYWPCARDTRERTVPIGRPVANTRAYVLDARGNPVPAGAAGELHLGGNGLARGYLNRPELTAEKFIPDPFSSEPGARLYRTGDLARHLPGGEIEYLGRIDHQVKIRGHRIELGEIESALMSHPSVRECVAVVREEGGDKRLAAYLVAEEGATAPEVAELRAYLKERLPEYMTPSAFVALDSLPLTPNGKVDRKALPAPGAAASSAGSYVAPRTAAEAELAAIWAEVLRAERVGATDNFFELGGHSLLATRVVTRVNEKYGRQLPLRAMFERPTVAEFAALVEQGEEARPSELIQSRRRGRRNLAQLMEKLEGLEESEARKILSEKKALRAQGGK